MSDYFLLLHYIQTGWYYYTFRRIPSINQKKKKKKNEQVLKLKK